MHVSARSTIAAKMTIHFGLLLMALFWSAGRASADCNQPAPEPIIQAPVAGHPFSAIPTFDGCIIFVSLPAEKQSHIMVLKRDGGVLASVRSIPADGQIAGMTLSPDGRFLAAATGAGVAIFDAAKLAIGAGDAVVSSSNDGPHAGAIYVAFTPDQHLLFVANERSASLSVYDVSRLPADLKFIGQIPTGGAPVGLAFSPDGKYLYSTSEVGARDWPAKCTSEGLPHPEGELRVIVTWPAPPPVRHMLCLAL